MHASSSPPPAAPAALDTTIPKLPTSDLSAVPQPSAHPESLIPRHSAYDFPDDEEVTARLLAGIAELDAEHTIARDTNEDFNGFTADDLEDES